MLVAEALVASGVDAADARLPLRECAETARVELGRALDLLGDPGFRRTVDALAAGIVADAA